MDSTGMVKQVPCVSDCDVQSLRSTPSPPCGSPSAPRARTYLRCGPACDRQSSITPSKVEGLKGLRRQRGDPAAVLAKPGSDGLADQGIVIDHQDAARDGFCLRSILPAQPVSSSSLVQIPKRISALFLFPPQT